MASSDILINDVSDTALWVAYYRAKESDRANSLFKDPLAQVLVGERGQMIAKDMESIGRYVEFTVVMRTLIIDEYISKVVEEGIDTVINLGAGLDTRPYRMNLPQTLRWIEVDHPNIIAHKNNLLKSQTPSCQLSRIAADLADDDTRKHILTQTAAESKSILVLTEGVVPYLSENQVAGLAADLHDYKEFVYWIVEYMNPRIYPYLQSSKRAKKMQNAPFRFFPQNWTGFFEKTRWFPKEVRYYGIEGVKHNRFMPMPWWVNIFKLLAPKRTIEESRKGAGFFLLVKR